MIKLRKFRKHQERLLLQLYQDIQRYKDSDGMNEAQLKTIIVSLYKAFTAFWCESDYSKEI